MRPGMAHEDMEKGQGSDKEALQVSAKPDDCLSSMNSAPSPSLLAGNELSSAPSYTSVRFAQDSNPSLSYGQAGNSAVDASFADESFGSLSAFSQPSQASTPSSRRGLLSHVLPSNKWRTVRRTQTNETGQLDTESFKSLSTTITHTRSEHEQYKILTDQLGYPDELKRDHDAWSLFGVCIANIGFLQGTLFGVLHSRHMGGSAPFAIGWPLGAVVILILSASMAEFASAFPVCGAMFTWTWKFCRASNGLKQYARLLSWINGSYLFIGHLFSQILLAYQFATFLQGTITLYSNDYERSIWRTVAIGWAEICVCGIIVSLPISRSPLLWKIVSSGIFITFLIMIIALSASTRDKQPAETVFFEYKNHTNFDNDHFVYLISWIGTCIVVGQDVAGHMAEETKGPAKAVPLALFWSVVVSYTLGWVSICVIFACVPDVVRESAFTPGAILLANMSRGLTMCILLLIMIAMIFQGVAQLLACSRFAWALARDKALPFSHLIRRVSKQRIPYVAVQLIVVLTLMGLLFVAVEEEIIQTLVLASAGTSTIIAYSMPCLLYLFASPTVLDEGGWRWTLRRSSKPVAGASFCIGGFLIVIFGFPQDLPITVRTFGWGPVAAIVSFAVMLLTWILYGRSHYAGPIKSVLGPSIELPKQSSSTSSASKTEQTPSEMVGRTTRIEEPGNTTGGMTDATTTEWTEGTETGIGTLSYATEAQSRV